MEEVLSIPRLIKYFTDDDFERVDDAVKNHIQEKWPTAPESYEYTVKQMYRLYDDSYKAEGEWQSEVEIEDYYTTCKGVKVLVRGKTDGLSVPKIAEHKCKGKIDGQQARLETPEDLQVNLYCKMLGCTEIIYDLIRIPEPQFYLPQRRHMERWSTWADRIFNKEPPKKDYPIKTRRHLWLDQFTVYRTQEEIDTYCKFSIDPLIHKLCRWWEKVTDPNFDPNNPDHHDEVFYRVPVRAFNGSMTEKFKCNYHSFLCGDHEISDLVPSRFYAELESVKE